MSSRDVTCITSYKSKNGTDAISLSWGPYQRGVTPRPFLQAPPCPFNCVFAPRALFLIGVFAPHAIFHTSVFAQRVKKSPFIWLIAF